MTLIEAIHDERFFRSLFKDLSTWNSWLVFFKVFFGLPIESRKDRRLFRQCTGLKTPPCKPAREAYVLVGRRGGKSFISAIIAVFLACFKDWRPFLSPGEKGWIFIIATDREQAKIIKNYIAGIFRSNPIFQRMVKKELVWQIELTNNVNIAVKTCNFKTVRGYTVLTAICEELAFWRDDNSANPDKEILTALRPALATIPESLLIGISTPYSRSGVLWETYRSHFGNNDKDSPLIWKASTKVMNPSIDKRIIEDALRKDYSAARAEWDAEFREDIEAFLSLELIEQAVVPGRIELPKIEGVRYFAFCDPSGGRQDSMTLAISHRDERTGKIVLDLIREAKPPFRPQEVVKDFSEVLKNYGISLIKSDRYAGEWVSSSFRDQGIMVENSELSASAIYLNFLPLISNGSIELLDNKRLISQFRILERKTRAGGKDLITHPPFSWAYDDLSNAASGACVFASMREENDEEILLELMSQQNEDLTEEEEFDRRVTTWLLGGELPPTKEEEEGKSMIGKNRTVLTVSEWDRRKEG